MPATCYLCGATENLTRDHVPPQCFFPPDVRENLITVRCCHTCNNGHSDDDEEIVRWLTVCAFNSPQGRWIFDNKVATTLKKSTKLARQIIEQMREMTLQTELGEVKGHSYPLPTEKFNAFVTRTCKGLLQKFLPSLDYSGFTFLCEHLQPTPEANKMLAEMLGKMSFVAAKGGTVFRFWHAFVKDHPDKGIFVLMFYDGVVMACFYGREITLSGGMPPHAA